MGGYSDGAGATLTGAFKVGSDTGCREEKMSLAREFKISPAVARLLEASRKLPGLDPRDPLDAVADPQWGRASRTNDWRNHVEPEIINVWDELSLDARIVAYLLGASDSWLE